MVEQPDGELICSRCKKTASWNTPTIDPNGNILCSTCSRDDRSGNLLIGINQRSHNNQIDADYNLEHFYNGHVLMFSPNVYGYHTGPGRYEGYHMMMRKPMYDIGAWTNDGASWPLTEKEKLIAIQDPLKILKQIDTIRSHGRFRCTTCHETFADEQLAGRPLFAGKTCAKCWKKHLEKLDEERKKGHVCSFCHEPYGNCCC